MVLALFSVPSFCPDEIAAVRRVVWCQESIFAFGT